MTQPITPDYSIGDIVVVRQDDCLPKLAEIILIDADPDRVKYCCKWGERITQWNWFYASEVRDATQAEPEEAR